MEFLLRKQMRGRSSSRGQEKGEEPTSRTDWKLEPQQTQSFREKMRSQSWIRRQFSREKNEDYDPDEGLEHAIAVAAAVYAVHSLEQGTPDQTRTAEGLGTSLTKVKTKKEETASPSVQEPGRLSWLFSGRDSRKSKESLEKEAKVAITNARDGRTTEKTMAPAPSFRRTRTNSDRLADHLRRKSPDAAAAETDADAWEKAETVKIRERYEKLKADILAWEKKKSGEAKSRLDGTEGELAKKRMKALEKWKRDVEYVKRVAGEARAKADERHRNEVLKVREKADIYRKTGKLPATCLCL